mgnify:CR=1 FL=1
MTMRRAYQITGTVLLLLAAFVAVLSVRGLILLGGLAKLIFLLELALIVWANVAVCRRVWRWANRPAAQGQPI